MIWYYDIDRSVFTELLKVVPANNVRHCSNPSTLSSSVQSGDLVIFFNYKHCKLYDSLITKGAALFPHQDIVYKLRNRSIQLKDLDTISSFPLKRLYVDTFTGFAKPNSQYPIMKVGNVHQGDGKYMFPDSHKKMIRSENIVYEEFVENHRAIRILIIGRDVFLIEQINEDNWIKNQYPTNEIVYHWQSQQSEILEWLPCANDLVNDATKLLSHIGGLLIGIDYAVGDKIGLLEANDMVGIPYHPLATKRFSQLINAVALAQFEHGSLYTDRLVFEADILNILDNEL